MKDKIKALDRNVIAFVVIALLAFGTYAFAGSDSPASTSEETAVAQEAEISETSTEPAEEAAPAEEPPETETATEEDPADSDVAPEEESTETTEAETENDTTYDYTAQAGDSYSEIARKAVQTYGIINDVDLSEAQIIYAETTLTQDAGEPLLEIGEAIAISESSVASVVEAAGDLDEATEALWSDYIVGVNFNTDAVGEPRE